ncbi:uncharacterized protein LOC128231066 [Mya arenaria]|uniref:uncharacterized protein LOC128231066 n=1 Tax=Mya arenaria TaxID=6604 RepID=UPI0022E8CBB0|nr:uncharacterized protein LOC128231066 [Mya arenaria]
MREGGSPFAQSECCPDMGGFVDGQGCIENKNCTDSCEKPIQMDGPKGCFLRKTEKPSVYFDGNANIERPCAPGTLFNEQACTCVQDVSTAVPISQHRTAIPNRPINCDTKSTQQPSFEVSIDTLYHEVIFKVDTYTGVAKKFKIMYNHNTWTEVDVIYDGERIVGAVDRRPRNMFAAGGIETRPYPISVGSCSRSSGFKGLMDDVNMYEDCVPDEMYGIFMSVLE